MTNDTADDTVDTRRHSGAAHLATAGWMALARVRSDWQYRTSFALFLGSQAAVSIMELAAILIVVDLTPSLGGWTPIQVLVLYGLIFTGFGLADSSFSSIGSVTDYVRAGEFDRVLLRPTPPLLQILALEFQLRRVGKLIPPAVTLVVALALADVDWTIGRAVYLVITLVAGWAIFGALFIVGAASTFWIIDSGQASNAATYGGSTAAQYPLHLYPTVLRTLLGWVIPVAFAGYVPAIYLLDASNPLGLPGWLVHATAPVAAATVAVALAIWRAGVAHYQSTGS